MSQRLTTCAWAGIHITTALQVATASVQPSLLAAQLVIGCPVLLAMEGQIRYSC